MRSEDPNLTPEDYIYNHIPKILSYKTPYIFMYGERSNGKTYGVLKHCLEEYCRTGKRMAYIRRWYEDLRGPRGSAIFQGLINNGEIEEITGGKWTGVYYYSMRWYLCKYTVNKAGDRKVIKDVEPFCYGFALNQWEHDKSSNFDTVENIIFDECLARHNYLRDEMILFMNTLSTIIRRRDNCQVWMLGNSVSMYSPYITEMGLSNFRKQKQGTVDIYEYGESGLSVCVYWCPDSGKNGAVHGSNKMFAFNNPRLKMITNGGFEIAVHPHLPYGHRVKPKDIVFSAYVLYCEDMVKMDVCVHDGLNYMICHPWTSDIKYPENEIVCYTEPDVRPNWRVGFGSDKIGRKLKWYFSNDKVFYSDNMVGEIMESFRETTGA